MNRESTLGTRASPRHNRLSDGGLWNPIPVSTPATEQPPHRCSCGWPPHFERAFGTRQRGQQTQQGGLRQEAPAGVRAQRQGLKEERHGHATPGTARVGKRRAQARGGTSEVSARRAGLSTAGERFSRHVEVAGDHISKVQRP